MYGYQLYARSLSRLGLACYQSVLRWRRHYGVHLSLGRSQYQLRQFFGGLQNPCEDSLVPEEGEYAQNTGGPVLANDAMDSAAAAVTLAWEALALEFEGGGSGNGDIYVGDNGHNQILRRPLSLLS